MGQNHFLKEVDITFRREEHSKRPRINKKGSVKDNEQKSAGEYYYSQISNFVACTREFEYNENYLSILFLIPIMNKEDSPFKLQFEA